MTSPWIERISEKFKSPSRFAIPLLFLLNIVLVFPIFFPNLNDIGSWDESNYINSGRLLVDGEAWNRLPEPAWNPLVTLLYAITYIPVQHMDFWLIHSCTIGRFILFSLLWLSAYLVTKQLSYLSHPLIMVGLLLVTPALTYLLANPTDALFAAMSAFALWQVLSFYYEKKIKHLWLASLFVGLSALSRNDGLTLFLIFVPLGVFLSLSLKRMGTCLLACILPFTVVVGSYIVLYGVVTGRSEFGLKKRSYLAFEQGQGFAYEYLYQGKNPAAEGQVEARRLFGTPEENRYSTLSAIKRNPEAFLHRVNQTIKSSPRKIYFMYGERAGIIILLLAAMGAVEIAKKRLYLLFLILLLWPAHIFVYLLTFFRHTYFLLPYFVVFSLATVSINFILYHVKKRRLYFWSILLLGLAVLGIISNRPNVFSATLFFLLGLWVIKIIVDKYQNLETIRPIVIILTLCLIFALKGSFIYPQFRKLGVSPYEKASLFMKEHLEPNARVLACFPRDIWNAKMSFGMLNFSVDKTDEKVLSEGIANFNIKAFYIDETFKTEEPYRWAIIQKLIGKSLEICFTSDNGEVEILLVNKK
jgi:hypothetical protein